MYTIKRHRLLNIFYIHDRYSGRITDEYEEVETVEDWKTAKLKKAEYESKTVPNTEGIFEDFYKYEHMQAVWGDLEGIRPSIGQLFFICCKEGHSQKRTLFELCEVKDIQEPYVIYHNYGADKHEKFVISAFQGLALIPERNECFISEFESQTMLRYPRNLISKLNGITDYRQVGKRKVALAKGVTDWDLVEFQQYKH